MSSELYGSHVHQDQTTAALYYQNFKVYFNIYFHVRVIQFALTRNTRCQIKRVIDSFWNLFLAFRIQSLAAAWVQSCMGRYGGEHWLANEQQTDYRSTEAGTRNPSLNHEQPPFQRHCVPGSHFRWRHVQFFPWALEYLPNRYRSNAWEVMIKYSYNAWEVMKCKGGNDMVQLLRKGGNEKVQL